MERLSVNGGELEFETLGIGEPVVLIHGSIIGEAFEPLLLERTLTERYALTMYHRRGFLGSTHPEGPISMEQQAADALAVIEHVAGGRAHVVGHSYGAVTALQLALDSPGAVHSLSLLEAPLPVPSAESFFATMPAIAETYASGNRAGAVDEFLSLVAGPGYRSVLEARLTRGWFERAVADIDTFFQVELPALGEWQFTAEMASRISQPVLAVVGSESHAFFADGQALLQEWLPQTESFVLPGATHALQMQNPQGMAEGLVAFLARHPMLAIASG